MKKAVESAQAPETKEEILAKNKAEIEKAGKEFMDTLDKALDHSFKSGMRTGMMSGVLMGGAIVNFIFVICFIIWG